MKIKIVNGNRESYKQLMLIEDPDISSIVLGIGNFIIGNIIFCQKNGFDLQEIWRNYFIDNYDEEIYESGIAFFKITLI